MTSKFDNFEHSQADDNLNEDIGLSADYFELISAYIDGELSPTEKKQVQSLLDQNPKVKKLYVQLLSLQGSIQSSVAPPSEKSVAEITSSVFKTVERRRRKRQLVWGGAIAASILAGIASLTSGITPSGLRMAGVENSHQAASPVMLAVAVNKPAIHIPKSINGYEFELQDMKN